MWPAIAEDCQVAVGLEVDLGEAGGGVLDIANPIFLRPGPKTGT